MKLVTVLTAAFALSALSLHGAAKADLSNFVVVGDSLSAGYQNNQLISTGQAHGYANVIATQAGVDLNLPLFAYPGYPQISVQGGFAFPAGFVPVPRLNNLQTRNLAVPGYTIGASVAYNAACNANPADFFYPVEVMAAEILNPTCNAPALTQISYAAGLHPTTSILWVGSNDALFAMLFGVDPTDPDIFQFLHHTAAAVMAQASGQLILANIPDATLTPYLTSLPKLATILNLTVPVVKAALGLKDGDMVTPYAFGVIQAMGNTLSPLPDSIAQGPVVLRAARIGQIKSVIQTYNAIIANEALQYHATLVDIYSLLNDLAANGYQVNGQHLTTDFMGGLFSLDGVHPTNTCYAIVANEFIKTMNRSLNTGISPASITQIAKSDPLVFPDTYSGKGNGHVSVNIANSLRTAFQQRHK